MNIFRKKPKTSVSGIRAGFSLVELLIVISIIALLAALTVGLAGRAAESKKRSQLNAEIAVIEMAIERYKEKFGYYPPDNTNDVTRPPLFYELTGTQPTNTDYLTMVGSELISGADVSTYFGRPGFANSLPGEAKNFLEQLKGVQYKDIKPILPGSNVKFLVVPVDGPNPATDIDGKPMNLWRYNSSYPTHNVDHFDLWAEVIIRGKTNIIGNWRK